MLADAAAGAWDLLVLYDIDRFGRNARLTMEALNTLADYRVETWDYSTGRQIDVESAEGSMITFMRAKRLAVHVEQVIRIAVPRLEPETPAQPHPSRRAGSRRPCPAPASLRRPAPRRCDGGPLSRGLLTGQADVSLPRRPS
jgi:hypothetical protein